MRKFWLAALCTVLLASCGGNKYKVSGKIDNVNDGDYVYMCTLENGVSLAKEDSAIISGGKFVFTGETDSCDIRILLFNDDGEGNFETCPFYLEAGKIKITQENQVQTVGGTKVNNNFQKFIDKMEEIDSKALDLDRRMREAQAAGQSLEAYEEEMSDLEVSYKAEIARSIFDNADNAFGLQQLLETFGMFEPIEVDAFIEALEPKYGGTYYIQELQRMVDSQLRVAVGCSYPNFSAQIYTDGGLADTTLKDIIGGNKITMLDFWASWCAPCAEEFPALKEAYAKYHDKGFEIVSVSVDEDIDEWKAALDANKFPWIQLLDNHPGTENAPSTVYGIKTIPSCFFISEDGVIVASNLRGPEYEAFLEDYLKEN